MRGAMICTLAVSLTAGVGYLGAAARGPAAEKPVALTLKDYRGKQYSLADFQDRKLVVLVFLGNECPLAKQYAPRLAKLAAEYEGKGVGFVGVNANRQDSVTEIAAYARTHGLSFPILKDVGNVLADRLGAERTPEVFVLDEQRAVRYRGRIDDRFGVGYARDAAKREDLRAALDELLDGKAVSVPRTEVAGCYIGKVREAKQDAGVTYSKQIARIFRDRCVECHRSGEIAPFALTSYAESAGWAETIAETVREERMPPWHAAPGHGSFANDRRLTAEEKDLIYRWAEAGAPEGDPKDLPTPRSYVSGWQLPREPDAVFPISERRVDVPTEGVVRYQYFRVDPKFTEDKWVKVAQVLPGNRAVVHHVLVFAVPPGLGALGRVNIGSEGQGFLAGYVPGLVAAPFPEGMAKKVEAGSQLIFQVHYTPIGSAQTDLSQLGLIFADPQTVTHEVTTVAASTRSLNIPPHADDHAVEATSPRAPGEVLLLSMMPHMHLRGKAFRYEAVYPDGKREVLLDVPRYDFNWQTEYRLTEPKRMPAGSRIHCAARFDNSEKNLNNPDPEKTVRWGDQTWDEMMIGYFDIAVPKDQAAAWGRRRGGAELLRALGDGIDRFLKGLDRDADGKLRLSDLPERLAPLFRRLDQDGDGEISVDALSGLLKLLQQRR